MHSCVCLCMCRYHPDFNPSGKAYSTIVHKNVSLPMSADATALSLPPCLSPCLCAFLQLAAPLHTHLTNWKVDLDVHGTQNRLEKTMSKVGYLDAQGTDQDGQLSAWPADVRSTNPLLAKASPPPSKYLKEALVTHEGAASQWTMNFHSPSVWRVVNAHATPIEGTENHPGYAIVPLTTNLQVLSKSHPFAKVARFADNHVTFTKRKVGGRGCGCAAWQHKGGVRVSLYLVLCWHGFTITGLRTGSAARRRSTTCGCLHRLSTTLPSASMSMTVRGKREVRECLPPKATHIRTIGPRLCVCGCVGVQGIHLWMRTSWRG